MRVALLAAAVVLGGCNLWYRPVPVREAIGKDLTIVAGDTFHFHVDPRFELYGPGSRPVFDGYEQLNRTYRMYERYFDGPAPRLAVLLYPEQSRPRDTAAVRVLRENGAIVVRFIRPLRASYRERQGDAGYEGSLWPVGPTAARLLLTSFAAPMAPHDTTGLARLPAWYRAAVMSVVGDPAILPVDVEYVKENKGDRLGLQHLLGASRAASADRSLDPYLRDDADGRDRMFASQSSAFMQFLLDREGPAVMASLGRSLATGASFTSLAAGFTVLPHGVDAIEERWLAWLAAQRPTYQ